MLWTSSCKYYPEPFLKESDLETAIQEVSGELFGPDRIYLDIKKKIGASGGTNSIPDGYLLDLTSKKKPILYVVENELSSHDPLRHVAVQILQFSLAYDASKQKVKAIIASALVATPNAQQQCNIYAQANGFTNIDYLLHSMIYDGEFGALVIIDELSDELEAVLANKLRIPVEVLTLSRYASVSGERVYVFEPFLADIATQKVPNTNDAVLLPKSVDTSDIDTIVVPAQDDGFQGTFLGEHRWYKIRIHASMLPKIKYIAAYRAAPISAITHIAEVQSIEPWPNSGKYVVNFAGPAQTIGSVSLVPGGIVKAPQNLRYTSHARLMKATTLDDAF